MNRLKLHWWILIGMAVGAVLGTLLHRANAPLARENVLGPEHTREQVIDRADEIAAELEKLLAPSVLYRTYDGVADIFLRLLKLVVIPLVFFSLLSGMLSLGDLTRLGRIGLKTFALYIGTSLLAIATGLAMVNIIRPGAAIQARIPQAPGAEVPESFWDVLVAMVPDNVVAAAARFDLIGVIIFTLFFGACLLAIAAEKRALLAGIIDAGGDVMMRMTQCVIALAPFGIAALIARLVALTGPEIFLKLFAYIATVLSGLAIHLLLTLPLLIYFFTRRNPYRYLRAMSPALLTGFSTASSSGTLPVTLERAVKGGGISNRVASFSLPLGATINMDGTALYEITSTLFIAQFHAAQDPAFTLTFGQQMLIVFLALMVSIGAAGIPHAGLVMMVIILKAVGLPVEYTGLVWMVDRPLDMCRTAVNIGSDSAIALIVAHGEKEVDLSVAGNRTETGSRAER